MRKILIKVGIFVEGQTERIFVVKYLAEYLGGEQNFSRTEIQHLGSRGTKILTTRNYPESNFYVLIFDCSGDGNVIPALRDRAQNMINQENYRYLIAIQDLYNRPRNSKTKVVDSFNELFLQTTYYDNLKFVLAIMEIEAWFITANADKSFHRTGCRCFCQRCHGRNHGIQQRQGNCHPSAAKKSSAWKIFFANKFHKASFEAARIEENAAAFCCSSVIYSS